MGPQAFEMVSAKEVVAAPAYTFPDGGSLHPIPFIWCVALSGIREICKSFFALREPIGINSQRLPRSLTSRFYASVT